MVFSGLPSEVRSSFATSNETVFPAATAAVGAFVTCDALAGEVRGDRVFAVR